MFWTSAYAEDSLAMRILADLSHDPELADRPLRIKVRTEDGVVTLDGVVNNREEKDLIRRKVALMEGVKSIQSHLKVKTSDQDLLDDFYRH